MLGFRSRVDAWIAVVSERAGQPADVSVLDEVERSRLEGFLHDPTARAYLVLHALTRQVVGSVIGAPAHAVRFDRTCPVCGRQHGRPTVASDPGLPVSLSRTATLVGLAVTRQGPVGIDVEQVAAANFTGFEQVALHPGERSPVGSHEESVGRANATAWVRKEAALKALGTGLRTDPATVFTPPSGIPTVIVPGTGSVTVTDLALRGRAARYHVAAVALLVEGDPAEVVVHTEKPSP